MMTSVNAPVPPSPGDWTAPEAVIALVDAHLARRPQMQVQDVYKLLYQGVLGSEHLLGAQTGEFELRLHAEYAALDPRDDEPLFEAIDPGASLHRLNLAPFKARAGDLAALLPLCLEAARQQRGSLTELQEVWRRFAQAGELGRWPGWRAPEIFAFSAWLEQAGFPPLHHSRRYRTAYRPSYRLIADPGRLG